MEKKFCELGEKIAKLMEEYKMRVYDLEFINDLIIYLRRNSMGRKSKTALAIQAKIVELIEKTIERDEK